MATTGFSPLKIAEVPRINPGLEILSAKALFLPTMDSPHTRRAYDRHLSQFISLLALETIGDLELGHLVAYRDFICKDGRGDPTRRFRQAWAW
jgi:hypothetical protein